MAPFSRRRLLKRAALSGSLLAFPGLAACSSSSTNSNNNVAKTTTTATARAAAAPPKAPPLTKLVISQVTDTSDLKTINPIARLHTLLPRNFIYDTLLTRDRTGIKPGLAESIEATGTNGYRIVL